MKNIRSLKQLSLANQRVIVREDFNVPLEQGQITSETRLLAALPTLNYLREQGAKILILSHLGRPQAGEFDPKYSLAPVAKRLSSLLNQPVDLIGEKWLDGVELTQGQIAIAENVRFLPGETENNPELAQRMAAQCDIFVMDAFAVAHRANASTEGIARFAPQSCAGFLVEQEIQALSKALEAPKKPVLAIIGGAKVSTKMTVLTHLLDRVDSLILGGGMMNTLLASQGYPVGKSLQEPEFYSLCKDFLAQAEQKQVQIPMPVDVITATEFSAEAAPRVRSINEVPDNEMILDVGPQTQALYRQVVQQASTILWNGPVGVFELAPFAKGTEALARDIAETDAFSIAGGGDTLAALEKFGYSNEISYLSTGGGAFIEFLEGKQLPGLQVLTQATPA